MKREVEGKFSIGVEFDEELKNRIEELKGIRVLVSLAHEDEASVGFVVVVDNNWYCIWIKSYYLWLIIYCLEYSKEKIKKRS